MALAVHENRTVGLTPNCVLIRRDGHESAIEDSAAPIHDRRGRVTGAVIVFHDVSATRAMSLKMSHLAHHDALTDLPNRMLLSDRLAHAIELGPTSSTARWPCCFWTWIGSSTSTTRWATSDWRPIAAARSPSDLTLVCAARTPSAGKAGTSSWSCCRKWSTQAMRPSARKRSCDAVAEPHHVAGHELHITASIGISVYPDDGQRRGDADQARGHRDVPREGTRARAITSSSSRT